jgi:hypothetical protein
VISTRYVPAACAVVLMALVPTIIHSYAGLVVRDARSTAAIPTTIAGFTSVPSSRDQGWGKRRFESDDWIERRYLSGADEVLLTVLRSYDLKRLYHHPELDVAYGAGYLSEEIVELDGAPGVPVHVLRASSETDATAMYALHYGDEFISNPLWFQVRVAGELLFRGRKPMTLVFARDVRGRKGPDPDSYPSAKVLVPVIQQFAAQGQQQR